MTSYRDSNSKYDRNNKKRHGRAFKISLSILVCLVVAAGVLFVTNHNTVALMMGKGNIGVNTISQVAASLSATGKFGNATVTGSAGQTQALTCISKDNAVTLTVTQQESGKETIAAKVDLKKMDFRGIDKKALLHGSPSAIQAAKALANSYVGTVVDPSDETGVEAYLVANLLSQYRSNPTSVNIDHAFGSAHLTITGNLSTGKIDVSITK